MKLGRASLSAHGLAILVLCLAVPVPGRGEDRIAAAPASPSFTYQGELRASGTPHSGPAEFHFKLFDAATGGVQIGPTLNFEGSTALTLENGRFTVQLNFGTSVFAGDARWLEVETRTGLGPFVLLSPRQPLTAAPYALYALNSPPNGQLTLPYVGTTSAAGPAFEITNTSGSDDVNVELARPDAGVSVTKGLNSASLAFGNIGVSGTGHSFGVIGNNVSPGNMGQLGTDFYAVAGFASGASSTGVYGRADNGPEGSGNEGQLGGPNEGAFGWHKVSGNYGQVGTVSYGVHGRAYGGGYGVHGVHLSNNRGALGTPSFGVYAFGDYGGTGGKYFQIDYPLDPGNKYLNHQCVEGPEPLLIYSGNVTLNNDGRAQVQLPEYFEAINRDFHYHLTPIGGSAPDLHVAREIMRNTFAIAGGAPGLKVSWTVTGIRNDPYMQRHAKPVVEDKPLHERGLYQYPELYGQPPQKALDYQPLSPRK